MEQSAKWFQSYKIPVEKFQKSENELQLRFVPKSQKVWLAKPAPNKIYKKNYNIYFIFADARRNWWPNASRQVKKNKMLLRDNSISALERERETSTKLNNPF